MKHLAALLTMAITLTGLAQQMPYNPDANGDDFVGVDDVLGVLGVYDTALMQPDLQCDYEGTELEEFILDVVNWDVILDSVYVEYAILDTLSYYTAGCPDLVVEPIILNRAYMLTQQSGCNIFGVCQGLKTTYFGFEREFRVEYNENTNGFELVIWENEIGSLPTYNSVSQLWDSVQAQEPWSFTLPFPNDWFLDEDGIHVGWGPHQWAANCEHLRVIPFWHEAE